MKRLRLSFLGSFALFSMLTSGLVACSSDAHDLGPSTAGTGGTPAAAGTAASQGGSPALGGGSSSGGSGNAGSATGGNATVGGSGPTSGGSANGGSSAAGAATQAGTGGSSAMGGSVGSGGGAATNAILSTDFESDAVGKQPAGWHNFIAYNIDAMNPQSDLQAIVDDTRPHGGKNSLHVKSSGGPAFITMPLPANIKKLYVRGYFYMTRQLGQNPGANHETLFGIRKDKDNEIRFGEIKGVIGVNEVPSDNISPKMDLWGKGPLIAANKWACIEAAFIGDQTQNELHAWADGTEVLSVTSGDQWQNGTEPAGWLSDKWKEFMIGWQSFSSAKNEIWIDDLVLSGTRVNCQ